MLQLQGRHWMVPWPAPPVPAGRRKQQGKRQPGVLQRWRDAPPPAMDHCLTAPALQPQGVGPLPLLLAVLLVVAVAGQRAGLLVRLGSQAW